MKQICVRVLARARARARASAFHPRARSCTRAARDSRRGAAGGMSQRRGPLRFSHAVTENEFMATKIAASRRGPGDDVPAEGAVVAQEGGDAAAVAQLHQHAQPPLPPLRLPVPAVQSSHYKDVSLDVVAAVLRERAQPPLHSPAHLRHLRVRLRRPWLCPSHRRTWGGVPDEVGVAGREAQPQRLAPRAPLRALVLGHELHRQQLPRPVVERLCVWGGGAGVPCVCVCCSVERRGVYSRPSLCLCLSRCLSVCLSLPLSLSLPPSLSLPLSPPLFSSFSSLLSI